MSELLSVPVPDVTAPTDIRDGDVSDGHSTALPDVPVTRPGDVWLLGDHRVMCGDSRNADQVTRLLDGSTVNLAFTSPPYASQRVYDVTSGFTPVPPDGYVDWFAPVAANVKDHLAPDGSWFVNIKAGVDESDWLNSHLYVMDLVLAHARDWGWVYATEFCWERAGVPKRVASRFKNQFEPVYQFTLGKWKIRPDAVRHASDDVPVAGGPGTGDTNWKDAQGGNGPVLRGPGRMANVQGSDTVGAFPREKRRPKTRDEYQTDIMHGKKNRNGSAKKASTFQGDGTRPGEYTSVGLAYPGNRLPTFSGSHTATGHTAAFPVGLPRFFVRAYTDPGDTVYDPFLGSGSTLLAAGAEDRTAFGMEISPGYCDVICRRYQQVTGTVPVLESSGTPHSFLDGES